MSSESSCPTSDTSLRWSGHSIALSIPSLTGKGTHTKFIHPEDCGYENYLRALHDPTLPPSLPPPSTKRSLTQPDEDDTQSVTSTSTSSYSLSNYSLDAVQLKSTKPPVPAPMDGNPNSHAWHMVVSGSQAWVNYEPSVYSSSDSEISASPIPGVRGETVRERERRLRHVGGTPVPFCDETDDDERTVCCNLTPIDFGQPRRDATPLDKAAKVLNWIRTVDQTYS
ncbi:hypothetical protein DL96DRAFT_920317 [Flagelloscypha sp. PMI_526]|nr:hypothetical protein DL96DRAFT_920317 [Flagelloscypha sp. PMI_526]